jgi:nucleotide-binding universal stress UspA family protein
MSIQFQTLLCPTDFSALSATAIPYAVSLANLVGARVHCVYVVDDAAMYWTSFGPEAVPLGPPLEELLAQGRARMERFAAEQFGGLKQPPTTHVRSGRPFAEIIACARENQIDLIVMGTHGRGAIAHMLLGSTTEKVVRKAPCAVLTVRAAESDFVMP